MLISRRISFLCGRVHFSGVILQSSSFARLVTPRRQTKVSAARSTMHIYMRVANTTGKVVALPVAYTPGGCSHSLALCRARPTKNTPGALAAVREIGRRRSLLPRRLSIGNTTCYSAGGQLPLCGVQHQSTSLATLCVCECVRSHFCRAGWTAPGSAPGLLAPRPAGI